MTCNELQFKNNLVKHASYWPLNINLFVNIIHNPTWFIPTLFKIQYTTTESVHANQILFIIHHGTIYGIRIAFLKNKI